MIKRNHLKWMDVVNFLTKNIKIEIFIKESKILNLINQNVMLQAFHSSFFMFVGKDLP